MFNNRDEYEDDVCMAGHFKVRAKPIVRYTAVMSKQATVGERFVIVPTDHPAVYLNGQLVTTSTVVGVGPDGSFETRNTRYVLAD